MYSEINKHNIVTNKKSKLFFRIKAKICLALIKYNHFELTYVVCMNVNIICEKNIKWKWLDGYTAKLILISRHKQVEDFHCILVFHK